MAAAAKEAVSITRTTNLVARAVLWHRPYLCRRLGSLLRLLEVFGAELRRAMLPEQFGGWYEQQDQGTKHNFCGDDPERLFFHIFKHQP